MANKTSSYSTRAMASQDPRYAKIFGKLGYKTTDAAAAAPARPAPPTPRPAKTDPDPAPVPAITTSDMEPAPDAPAATPAVEAGKPDPAPSKRKAKAVLDSMDGMSFFELKAAAAKVLGDKTPSKKADIIAALQAVAEK